MQSAISATPNTEEYTPDYHCRAVYAPFVWLAMIVLRAGFRLGIFSAQDLMPSKPKVDVNIIHRNRQLRRARASCLSRARRHALKGRRIKPENYTPRAYAHYAYVNMMDKTISPGQFMERYIRDNDLSRVQVYAMDSADRISRFTAGATAVLSNALADSLGVFGLNAAALSDPAPP